MNVLQTLAATEDHVMIKRMVMNVIVLQHFTAPDAKIVS